MNKTVKSYTLLMVFLICQITLFSQEEADSLSWPLEITSKDGAITTLYQPQLESFKSNILEGRMAVTIQPKDKDMIFGALWFKARLSTDLDARTIVLEEMNIVKTHFPDIVDEEKQKKFSNLLSAELESWNLVMSLDRILASLNETEQQLELSDQMKNDPPKIYFRDSPTVLMLIDGDPILKETEETGIEYVVNTPFFMVKDVKKEQYYIKGGDFWYSSAALLSGWEETTKVPSKIEKFAASNKVDQQPDTTIQSYTEAPEIIVSTGSSELIIVDGKINYKPIESTNLLYVENTESDIIMDISSQEHYVLLAGRWFSSKSLNDGDWKFCEPKDLPQDFEKIPEKSDIASVRSSVPNTPESQTALLEQSIPQTATIDRKQATVEVKYDGNPKFEKVESTDMSYAVNTDKTVLLISNKYYCVDDAVWFISDKATGPWEVCVVRPDEVDQIPPEAPVYNVKYTYIYDSTPDVVYVGYLPGYTYSYVYGGVVVYGTGYYYYPWYGHYYYPRPVTWGFGVHYNPYTGWGFSVGISYGYMGWGFHPYSRCYWGPRGYHHGYRHGYHHGYRHGYRAGYHAGQRNANRNVYHHRSSGVRKTGNIKTRPANTMNNKARPANKPNNMFTDKSGNVYQRDNNGSFQNKSNKISTQPTTKDRSVSNERPTTRQQPAASQRPSTTQQPRQNQNSQQQLNRSYQNRNQGTTNYNRSQQMQRSGGSRPMNSGGSRGGGGARRR